MTFTKRSVVVTASAMALLVGCVPSKHAVRAPVASAVQTRLGPQAQLWSGESSAQSATTAATTALIGKPITAEAAVALSLQNNRKLRIELISLGIPAGAIADATAPRPTDVDMLYRRGLSDASNEIEFNVTQDLIELVTTGTRRSAAKLELQAAQQRATAMVIDTAGAAQVAWYRLVAEQELYQLRTSVAALAESSFDFASVQHAAGNVPDLVLLREQDNKAQADLDVAKSFVEVTLRRGQLAMVMGISDDPSWTVDTNLPTLPETLARINAGQNAAVVAQSLELAGLQAEADAASVRLRLAKIRSWVPELGAGVSVSRRSTSGTSAEWELGPAIRLALPLFNWNQGGRAVANAELARSQHRKDAFQQQLLSMFTAAVQRQQATYQQARQVRDTILPLRKKILAELVLHYNAMNATPFELLLARRAQAEASQQYIELLRDYWIAQSAVTTMQRGGMQVLSDSTMGE